MIAVAAGILRDADGRVLIAQRPPGSHVAGFWEFPGGKLHANEAPLDALRRELREELGVEVETATPLMRYQHAYPEKVVDLHVYTVLRFSGEPKSMEQQALRWVSITELASCGLLAADLPICDALSNA